jgi:hypothetical protein
MISPASFNYYQECLVEAEQLFIEALVSKNVFHVEDLQKEVHDLMIQVPEGILLND